MNENHYVKIFQEFINNYFHYLVLLCRYGSLFNEYSNNIINKLNFNDLTSNVLSTTLEIPMLPYLEFIIYSAFKVCGFYVLCECHNKSKGWQSIVSNSALDVVFIDYGRGNEVIGLFDNDVLKLYPIEIIQRLNLNLERIKTSKVIDFLEYATNFENSKHFSLHESKITLRARYPTLFNILGKMQSILQDLSNIVTTFVNIYKNLNIKNEQVLNDLESVEHVLKTCEVINVRHEEFTENMIKHYVFQYRIKNVNKSFLQELSVSLHCIKHRIFYIDQNSRTVELDKLLELVISCTFNDKQQLDLYTTLRLKLTKDYRPIVSIDELDEILNKRFIDMLKYIAKIVKTVEIINEIIK